MRRSLPRVRISPTSASPVCSPTRLEKFGGPTLPLRFAWYHLSLGKPSSRCAETRATAAEHGPRCTVAHQRRLLRAVHFLRRADQSQATGSRALDAPLHRVPGKTGARRTRRAVKLATSEKLNCEGPGNSRRIKTRAR